MTEDVEEGVKAADFLETDARVSIGEPQQRRAQRIEQMRPYQVNSRAMELTGNPDRQFLHSPPALHNWYIEVGRRIGEKSGLDGMEETEDVPEAEASIVRDEAENRVHTIEAVMAETPES